MFPPREFMRWTAMCCAFVTARVEHPGPRHSSRTRMLPKFFTCYGTNRGVPPRMEKTDPVPPGKPGRGRWLIGQTIMGRSTASGAGPAGVALAAGAAAHQGQLAALGARVALVTLQARQAHFFLQSDAPVAVVRHERLVAVAVFRQRVQVAAAR